jgi:hypothetical protein
MPIPDLKPEAAVLAFLLALGLLAVLIGLACFLFVQAFAR